MRRANWLTLVLLAGLSLTGCVAGGQAAPNQVQPATVESIQGSDVSRVTLTEQAAGRIGIRTEPVRAAGGAARVVPFAAVLYDAAGQSWAYTSPAPLTFVRAPITVDRIDGDRAYLRSGPAPGTAVVTVGVAELLGAEYGVDGE
jgi:hypothetical protein